MREQHRRVTLLFLAVSTLYQTREASSLAPTYGYEDGLIRTHKGTLGNHSTSTDTRGIGLYDAGISCFVRDGKLTGSSSGGHLHGESSSSFELVRERSSSSRRLEWFPDREIVSDVHASVDTSISGPTRRTTFTDAGATPHSATASRLSLRPIAPLLNEATLEKTDNSNLDNALGNDAIASSHDCCGAETVVAFCEDAGEHHSVIANGIESSGNTSQIADSPDESGTSTISLAPGWKQQASWTTTGAGVWVGGCMFALAWTVLLC